VDVVSHESRNVRRMTGAGDPATELVLLEHTHTQKYIAVQDNEPVCIPLQDDPTCTFIFIL